ncbi:MAG: prepilin-type N-terminal cleavage/methylation domain-containing protein [Deltaproteobacteria bacterium]
MCREKKGIGMIKSNKGFTLMELIIVMAILAVLVTLALLYYGNVGKEAYANALMADLKAVDEAIGLYENKYGSLPVVETATFDLETKTTTNVNVPAGLKIAAKVNAYTIDATNANFMNYLKKTSYLLKGTETGDVRGAGRLYYVDSVASVVTGTSTAAAGKTITLAAGSNATDDYYKGCTINITDHTGVGQSRVITSYAGAGKVATVNSDWATGEEPAASDYTILPPVKAGDLVFVQSNPASSKLTIKDASNEAIYKY